MGNLIENKVVIVTGGAGLIGTEFINAIIKEGGIGIIADLNEEKGKALSEEIKRKNGKADFIKLNIISKESVLEMVDQVKNKYGKIDALVNCAYPKTKNFGLPFEKVSYQDFCENINLHLGGFFLTSQQISLFFKNQGYGNIINISSIYGVIPPRFHLYEGTTMSNEIEYAAIKSAIIHMTKYLARYFKGCNIRFNCISPGGVFDDQNKDFIKKYNLYCSNKGMLDKDDLNGTLIYLLSDLSKYVNGQNIIVDDGFSL